MSTWGQSPRIANWSERVFEIIGAGHSEFSQGEGFMKKALVALIGAVVFLAVLGASGQLAFSRSLRQSHHEPALIDKDSFSITFRIPNYTFRRIPIESVSTSCGCTVVEAIPAEVGPFEVLKIPMRIDLAGKAGAFRSTAVVQMGTAGDAQLEITANVYPAMPKTIDFGSIMSGTAVTKEFVITEPVAALIQPCVQCSRDEIAYSLSEFEGLPLLKVSYTAGDERGPFSFPLFSKAPLDRSVQTIITGYVPREVEPDAPTVFLGYLDPKDTSTANAEVSFRSSYGESYEWRQDLTKNSDSISLSRHSTGKDVVAVSLKVPGQQGIFRETLEVAFQVGTTAPRVIYVPVEVYAYIL